MFSTKCVEDKVHIVLPPETPLVELSFSIETAINYFLGKGVNQWEIRRFRLNDEACRLECTASMEPRKMLFSGIASLTAAVKANYFPKSLIKNWTLDEKETAVSDGQNKSSGKESESIIVTHDLKIDMPIGMFAYGLSDLITGLFARRVNYVKWQGSVESTQLYFKHKFSHSELQRFLDDRSNPDYNVDWPVSKLK